MQELFRNIEGYEGLYQVSNLGRVRSFKVYKGGKVLTLVQRKGYITVTLCKNGKSKIYSVHRLVAEAFIPNPDSMREVNHIDGNKLNNDVSNLEWCTHLENMRHAFKSGLIERKPLTPEQKKYISMRTKEAINKNKAVV